MDDNCATRNEEEWRPVVGYEGLYEVSNRGRVRSVVTRWGNPRLRLLKPRKHTQGYQRVNLCRGNGPKDHYIHALVLAAFDGKCPSGFVRNHKDASKAYNDVGNLEYVTPARNNEHARENGLIACGSRHPNARANASLFQAKNGHCHL